MPINLLTGRLRSMLVARILIAATLTVALVVSIAPFGLTSSAHLCTMSCCAGKPPHEAGSCHANFSVSKPPSPLRDQEEHCGITEPQMAQHGEMLMQDAPPPIEEDLSTSDHQPQQVDSLAQEQSSQNRQQQTKIAAGVLTKPCPQDCGAGIFSYSSQRRPRDSASLSYADKPRPPTSPRLQRTSDNVAKVQEALYRRARPRGPPLSFS